MNITEIISKFNNGEERYLNSHLIHTIIDSLHHGADEIQIMDMLVESIEALQESYKELLMSSISLNIIIGDEEDYIKVPKKHFADLTADSIILKTENKSLRDRLFSCSKHNTVIMGRLNELSNKKS